MRAACLAALLALAAGASAQADPTTPGVAGAEATVRAYVAAFAGGDGTAAARLMDPAEVAEFVDLMGLLGDADPDDEFVLDTAGDPAEAFGAFLETVFGAQAGMTEAMGSLEAAVIGTVLEGDSLAHVVGRARFSMLGGEMQGVDVTTLRWTGERWVVTFGEKLAGLRHGIRRGLEMRDEEDDG